VNIMKEEIRDFYDLEGLWGENTLLDNINQWIYLSFRLAINQISGN
jgi:hypothetical protein